MGKPEDNTSDWVSRRMSALDPDAKWEPDLDRGVRHMRSHAQHIRRRRRMRQGTLLAILIAGVVFVSMPATRGVAERLLNRFSSKDVEAVRVNRSKLDLRAYLSKVEVVTPPGASNRV